MLATIKPSFAHGIVHAPASKSAAHRLLIAAGLSQGTSRVSNVELSKDIEATLNCLKALGVDWTYDDHTVTIHGGLSMMESASGNSPDALQIPDDSGGGAAFDPFCKPERQWHHTGTLPCNECGSTLRFFVPVCLLSDAKCTLTGSEKLLSRPMQVYEKLCREQGLSLDRTEEGLVTRGPLKSGTYEIAGNISSQFITGLLFALPLLEGESLIKVTGAFESKPYVDLTLGALRTYGIVIEELPDNCFRIPGPQVYKACDSTVEGDWSNAAFLYALEVLNDTYGAEKEGGFAGSLPAEDIFTKKLQAEAASAKKLQFEAASANTLHIEGVSDDSLQGDKVCIPYYKALCAGTPTLDVSDCPDLAPVLFAMAGVLHGAVFTGTRRLAFKESDRVQAMKEELVKLGITVTNDENSAVVTPADGLEPPTVPICGHNDHRIVMAMATILTLTGGCIEGAQAVTKSYPDYFEQIQKLGISAVTQE